MSQPAVPTVQYSPGNKLFRGFNFKQYKPPYYPVMELFYGVKFIKTFMTPFDELPAFKMGIIDKNGKVIKKKSQLKTRLEREEYSPLNQICWLIKQYIAPIPGLVARLQYRMWNLLLRKIIVREDVMKEIHRELLSESTKETETLTPGFYRLTHDLLLDMGKAGDVIEIKQSIPSMGNILGQPAFVVRLDSKDEDYDRIIILTQGEYEILDSESVKDVKTLVRQKFMTEDSDGNPIGDSVGVSTTVPANSTDNLSNVELAKFVLGRKPPIKRRRKSFLEKVAKV